MQTPGRRGAPATGDSFGMEQLVTGCGHTVDVNRSFLVQLLQEIFYLE